MVRSIDHDLHNSASESIEQGRERCLLAILHYATRAQLEALVTSDEMRYDDHLKDFQRLVALCEQFLQTDVHSGFYGGTRRAHDKVIEVTLYLVGCKRRHREMRRAAVRLLYQFRGLEGLWSTTMLGIIAKHVMKLEKTAVVNAPDRTTLPRSRVNVTSFHYSPGLLVKEQQNRADWENDSPQLEIMYECLQTYRVEPQVVRVALKPYCIARGFGQKGVFLWPTQGHFAILDALISEDSKAVDGPRLGFPPFSALANEDLQNRLRMRPFMMLIA